MELRKQYHDLFFDDAVDLVLERIPRDELVLLLETIDQDGGKQEQEILTDDKDRTPEDTGEEDTFVIGDAQWQHLKDLARTSSTSTSDIPGTTTPLEFQLRTCAFELAAACYICCYARQFQSPRSNRLYSFPWVVAGDVIGAALDESRTMEPTPPG